MPRALGFNRNARSPRIGVADRASTTLAGTSRKPGVQTNSIRSPYMDACCFRLWSQRFSTLLTRGGCVSKRCGGGMRSPRELARRPGMSRGLSCRFAPGGIELQYLYTCGVDKLRRPPQSCGRHHRGASVKCAYRGSYVAFAWCGAVVVDGRDDDGRHCWSEGTRASIISPTGAASNAPAPSDGRSSERNSEEKGQSEVQAG